jgi:hypothetical protein
LRSWGLNTLVKEVVQHKSQAGGVLACPSSASIVRLPTAHQEHGLLDPPYQTKESSGLSYLLSAGSSEVALPEIRDARLLARRLFL